MGAKSGCNRAPFVFRTVIHARRPGRALERRPFRRELHLPPLASPFGLHLQERSLIHAMLTAIRQARRAALLAAFAAVLLSLGAARAADTTTQPAPVPGQPAAPAGQPAATAGQPAATTGQPAAATAQGGPKARLVQKFKDWALVCIDSDNKPATPDDCYLNDIPADTGDTGKLMAVVIGYATTDKGERLLALRFAFAPSTDKEAGFDLAVGTNPVLHGAIAECKSQACETQVMPMSPDFVDAIKKGSKMVLGFKLKDKGPVTVPVSLSGITAALAALAKGAPPATAAAAPAPAPAPAAQGPAPKVVQQYGDWALLCVDADGNPATPAACYLEQAVQSPKQGQALMAAKIAYAVPKEGGERKLALQYLFPPATQQAAGFQVAIDDKPVLQGPIVKCEKMACVTGMVMPAQLLDLMKKGSKMSVVFTLKDKGQTTAAVSLKGFGAAIDGLAAVKS
jgi:invasion protein IalB